MGIGSKTTTETREQERESEELKRPGYYSIAAHAIQCQASGAFNNQAILPLLRTVSAAFDEEAYDQQDEGKIASCDANDGSKWSQRRLTTRTKDPSSTPEESSQP